MIKVFAILAVIAIVYFLTLRTPPTDRHTKP